MPGQKRTSISATLVFADLRQVTNEIEEAHLCSILADGIEQDRRFLLSLYESTSLAHNSALDVEDVDVEKREDKRGQVLRALRAVREPALFISSKSNLPFFDLGHSGRRSE
ncbi:hypothetical protein [Bradyrhizobium sp.]|uniref:hypothetical protein n=1 Tax=Bradyrhizobium sp. TaxID=376 RepID=UPI003C58E3AD